MNKASARCGRGLFFYLNELRCLFCVACLNGVVKTVVGLNSTDIELTAFAIESDHKFIPLIIKRVDRSAAGLGHYARCVFA